MCVVLHAGVASIVFQLHGTGTLPSCLPEMNQLVELQIAGNLITGSLPDQIGKLSSLVTLDISDNLIRGSVPLSFGDLAPHLDTSSLELNHLSCELPLSVLHWDRNNNLSSFKLLSGNLFSCPASDNDAHIGNLYFGYITMASGAPGLLHANKDETTSYICGNSEYYIPIWFLLGYVLPFTVVLALQFRTKWDFDVSKQFEHCYEEYKFAAREMKAIVWSVVSVLMLGIGVGMPMVNLTTDPLFDCEFASHLYFSNLKGKSSAFSIGSGALGAAVIVTTLLPWWRRWKLGGSDNFISESSHQRSSNRPSYQLDTMTPDSDLEPSFEEPSLETRDTSRSSAVGLSSIRNSGASASTGSTPVKMRHAEQRKVPFEKGSSYVAVFFLEIAFMSVSVIAPNVGYVYLSLMTGVSSGVKMLSAFGISLLKAGIITIVLPVVSAHSSSLLSPGVFPENRFRFRLCVSGILAALTGIAPIVAVMIIDEGCFNHIFYPPPPITTTTCIPDCNNYNDAGECIEVDTSCIDSTYTPEFRYSGERCVAAWLKAYVPVFMLSILFAAVAPAIFEVVWVPMVAPWCFRNHDRSSFARGLLYLMRLSAFNVSAVLAAACDASPAVDVDALAQLTVHRGLQQLHVTLLAAATFGILSPAVVGIACVVAAAIQYCHHLHVMSQLVDLAATANVQSCPDLAGCSKQPRFCSATTAASSLLVLSVSFYDYIDEGAAAVGAVGMWSAVGIACCAACWRHLRRKRLGAAQDPAAERCFDTVQSPLQNPLLPQSDSQVSSTCDADQHVTEQKSSSSHPGLFDSTAL